MRTIFFFFGLLTAILLVGCGQEKRYYESTGEIFHTRYSIKYEAAEAYDSLIVAELARFDLSLNPFNPQSIIAQVNRNEPVAIDSWFRTVFLKAYEVSEATGGAYDITCAPLVNLWGFGFSRMDSVTPALIDSVRTFVGYRKVRLEGDRVVKSDPRVMLDCASIAKGYACDVVADFLRKRGIENFMVEIGGEIVARGINDSRLPWKIGVTKPVDDSLDTNREIQTVLNVTNKAMATSGNYRNFYYKNGKKYAHTIDPKTGYPVQHNILSATVLAADCATADAYATAFMVMGLDGAKDVLKKHPELMAYFIYSDDNGNNAVWFSPSMRDKIIE